MESTISESDITFHEKIGQGGSGSVHRATWKSKTGNIEVAAKRIEVQRKNEIKLEVESLKRLQHENVIKYYGQVITPNYIIVLTEYAAKGSLYDYLKSLREEKKHLDPNLALKWAIEATRAIQHLKQQGITHRDVKTPNFVITADDTLKITDFGIAKFQDDNTKTTLSTDKGTVRWQAPEVFTDGKVSPKADVFALGVVLWELITGNSPYEGMSNNKVIIEVILGGKRPEIPSNCPEELKNLMSNCWDKDRDQRPDVADALKILEKLGRSN